MTRIKERLTITIEGEHVSGVRLAGVEPGQIVGVQLNREGQAIDFSDRGFVAEYVLQPTKRAQEKTTWRDEADAAEESDGSLLRATPRDPRALEVVSYLGGSMYAPLRKILDYSDVEDIRELPLQCSLCANVSHSLSHLTRKTVKCKFDDAYFEARTFLACDTCKTFTATAARAETFVGLACPECEDGHIIPYWPKM